MDPNWTGGGTLEYTILPKLTLSVNSYFYSSYQMITQLNRPSNGEISIDPTNANNVSILSSSTGNYITNPYNVSEPGTHISSKVIFNAKIDYKITKQLSAFVNARKLTNNTNREWQYTDQVGGFYLLGLTYNY